jgi:hypothetical protein
MTREDNIFVAKRNMETGYADRIADQRAAFRGSVDTKPHGTGDCVDAVSHAQADIP